jgi:hypothetical protein
MSDATQLPYDPTDWVMGATKEDDNSTFELPPVDVYTFKLVGKDPDMKQKPEYDPSGTKLRARFHFEVVDDEDWKGTVIKVYYNLTLNDQGFWLPVVEALLGRPLEATERVGFKAGPGVTGLEGRLMRATLKHDTKSDGKVYPRLESPMPAKTKKGKATDASALSGDETPAIDAGPPPF